MHLAPLFSIFLPEVVTKMYRTLQFADEAAGWAVLVEEDSNNKELYAAERMQPR
jgi:L-rhamnose mutarotase